MQTNKEKGHITVTGKTPNTSYSAVKAQITLGMILDFAKANSDGQDAVVEEFESFVIDHLEKVCGDLDQLRTLLEVGRFTGEFIEPLLEIVRPFFL